MQVRILPKAPVIQIVSLIKDKIMNAPKITITADYKSGKSSLAYLIKCALSEYGIESEIIGIEDELPGVIANTYQARVRSVSKALNGSSILIETIQRHR